MHARTVALLQPRCSQCSIRRCAINRVVQPWHDVVRSKDTETSGQCMLLVESYDMIINKSRDASFPALIAQRSAFLLCC